MSQECKELCDKITNILHMKRCTDFEKCNQIKQIISGNFGNDLIQKYPKIAQIIADFFKFILQNPNEIEFYTKYIIDAWLIPGKIGQVEPTEILNYIKARKSLIKQNPDAINQPLRIIERMIQRTLSLYQDDSCEFVRKARQIHSTKFDYSNTCYVDDSVPVSFQCTECAKEFQRYPTEHLHDNFACLGCFVRKRSNNKKLEKSNKWSQIMGGLYLGEYSAVLNVNTLATCKIKAIVDLTNGTNLPRSVLQMKLEKHIVKVSDTKSANIEQYFDECIRFIDAQIAKKKNVLVYCKQGVSRSASIVIAYLMAKTRAKLENVHAYVRKRRIQIRPNDGFMKQLKNFEAKLLNTCE